ncbi:peroxidase P7-like [Benincasa hispida]|uniref:peroxidase P7-like n=1 Tax=Benincasa hispida TaxID=102211 RepID=UPI0018FF5778|nr:peroxidase P7-like [Benincasa hispida]
MASLRSLLLRFIVLSAALSHSHAQLTPNFYNKVCPKALSTIKSVVINAIRRERRMGASLLRLHFHDCFVNGCDGSVLLDDTATFTGEKTAFANINSIRGFEVVDEIKTRLDKACKGNVVSCADILAVAARDSVAILGGPNYKVLLGRRDARTASADVANRNLPPPFFSFSQLLSNFQSHGLDIKDLVVLSAGHTLGNARCTTFRTRIYNDTNIDPQFAAALQGICPQSGGDENLKGLDKSPNLFDTAYFKALLTNKGLLHSDQELFGGGNDDSDGLVKYYSRYPNAFRNDFGSSMIKMGNMNPLTGSDGEIRANCRFVN